ncbi:hypothetical protein GXM_02332 [Nostoc sphaeroides CCNUC1]|uniref:Uncharacterized protein n=1 Tax=Nostoc sphaeroides CCNUC1 TaxID=2653204 RepID=A0A5P8VWW0_9NOSO|nr:hypothetical protein GXM_02332 [Nostoc sphaeroides CCNUC1]
MKIHLGLLTSKKPLFLFVLKTPPEIADSHIGVPVRDTCSGSAA